MRMRQHQMGRAQYQKKVKYLLKRPRLTKHKLLNFLDKSQIFEFKKLKRSIGNDQVLILRLLLYWMGIIK